MDNFTTLETSKVVNCRCETRLHLCSQTSRLSIELRYRNIHLERINLG